MYKQLFIVGLLSFGIAPAFAQSSDSTINKCDNGKDPIVYTEFDCPEGFEIVTEGWLSETNMTSAEKFGDETRTLEPEASQNNDKKVRKPVLE